VPARAMSTRSVVPTRRCTSTLRPAATRGLRPHRGELAVALQAANVVQHAGTLVADGDNVPVQAGEFLADRDDVAATGCIRCARAGRSTCRTSRPSLPAPTSQQYVTFGAGPAGARKGIDLVGTAPAVTLAISKKPAKTPSTFTNAVLQEDRTICGLLHPRGSGVTVTRNYGETRTTRL